VPSFALIRRLNDRATFAYDGTALQRADVQPIAPNDRFYTVTKNVVDPDVALPVWRLQVGGQVEAAADLRLFRPGGAAGGRSGYDADVHQQPDRRRPLLQRGLAGDPDARPAGGRRPGRRRVEVLLHAADGYTDTFAVEKAMDPTTLVAYRMNGEPLPRRHGFPARSSSPASTARRTSSG
jgi:DMSO/TMAO reductase YedYZ molybdopterin-dependent catalytic subunit